MAIRKISNPAYYAEKTPDPTVLDEDRRVAVDLLAYKLTEAFNWDVTAEGYHFWEDVHARLHQIARDGILKEE